MQIINNREVEKRVIRKRKRIPRNLDLALLLKNNVIFVLSRLKMKQKQSRPMTRRGTAVKNIQGGNLALIDTYCVPARKRR